MKMGIQVLTTYTARWNLALPKILRKPFRLSSAPYFSRGVPPGYDDLSLSAKGIGMNE